MTHTLPKLKQHRHFCTTLVYLRHWSFEMTISVFAYFVLD